MSENQSESQAKGDIILRVLDQVILKWGNKGLGEIGRNKAQYKEEQWYPFQELCDILKDIKIKLGKNSPLTVYQLGFRTVKEDPRWQDIFFDQNPADIFTSTKRQEGQYRAGTQEIKTLGNKHIQVELIGWGCDDVWYDFFRGRLQGVLELTGRTGVVHLMPKEDESIRILDIKWG